MDSPQILIIGAGELGQALGSYLLARGDTVVFWDINSAKIVDPRPLHEIIPTVDFVFLCIPSWAVRSVLSDSASALRPSSIVVSFSKGIDVALQRETTAELLPELLPENQPFVVVGGPMLAAEITAGKNTAAVFASPTVAAAEQTADLFRAPMFAVEISDDAVSVSLAGVLKNIYAIGLGIADGLELDDNAKGWIVARAVNEMMTIAEIFGADKKIILGTAGLADFIATGYSPYSRNREVGHEIVKNGKCNLKGEGIVSIPPLMARLGPHVDKLPLLKVIKKIAIDCAPPKPTMDAYFTSR